jgi:hypothetical protein
MAWFSFKELGSLFIVGLSTAQVSACNGKEPPVGGDTGGTGGHGGSLALGGSTAGGSAGAGAAGGSRGGTAGSGGAEPTCGGMSAGSCLGSATCECCPGGGPTQHCLCTTPCSSSTECLDPTRPICDRPTTGGPGLCRDASFTCCWGCN